VSGTLLNTDLSAVPVRKITTAQRHTIFHPPPQGQQYSTAEASEKNLLLIKSKNKNKTLLNAWDECVFTSNTNVR
jgi:hypothetical protein